VILEPALFFAGSPLRIRGRFSEVSVDATGNVRVIPRPAFASATGSGLARPAARRAADTLELPVLDRRIVPLALTGRRFQAMMRRAPMPYCSFHSGFEYTLEPGDPGLHDPLARFL
jgi:hypothetical protein